MFYFTEDPVKLIDSRQSYNYFKDGLLAIEDGKVVEAGYYDDLISKYSEETPIDDYTGKLIMPGFIDTHLHYTQLEMMASYGEQLLTWLNNYTFPTEKKYKNRQYAKKMAELFLQELLQNGTTTAVVFTSVFKDSVDVFFEASSKLNMRMIAGKLMMDRNAPPYLLDTPDSGFKDSEELIKKWHRKQRQLYTVTPRFAPTSSEEQLRKASELLRKYPDVGFIVIFQKISQK